MEDPLMKKCFAIESGKLHMPCPYKKRTGVDTHVVIKDGYCYRSDECTVVWCKFNSLQKDLDSFISLIW